MKFHKLQIQNSPPPFVLIYALNLSRLSHALIRYSQLTILAARDITNFHKCN